MVNRRETLGFVTVLIPAAKGTDALAWVSRIGLLPVEPERAGLGVWIDGGEKKIVVAVKNDLRRDIARDWRRPKYTYEAGKIHYGEFETNGDFLFASTIKNPARPGVSSLSYTIVNLTKALYRDQVLIEAQPSFCGLAIDGSPAAPGVGNLRY